MDKIYIIGKDALPQAVTLGAGGELRMILVALPGVSEDVALKVDLQAPQVHFEIDGLFLCTGSEKLNLKIDVCHNASGCYSRQLFKGIVGGTAKVGFDGLIYVKRDSQQTKAFQECHSILLSQDALVEVKPQLEIYADDVECSHGATSGFLNADERFYMQSRGIPEAEARALQMISFLSAVADKLPEDIRQQVYDSIS